MSGAALFRKNPASMEDEFLMILPEQRKVKRSANGITIGTSSNVDLKINEIRCNGVHALVEAGFSPGSYVVVDLGSKFGTYVKGKRIQEAHLKIGDSFIIGQHQFILKDSTQANQLFNKAQLLTPSSQGTIKAEASVALVTEKTALEVCLYWGEQLLDARTFNPGITVTLGNQKDATFGVPLTDPKLQNSPFQIAKYEFGCLELSLPPEATGLVWLGPDVYALDMLRHKENTNGFDQNLKLSLRIGDRAHVEFGELTLIFSFVQPPEKLPLQFLSRIDKDFAKIFAAFLMLYGALLLFLTFSNPSLDEKTLEDVPKHLKQVLYDAGIEDALKRQQAAIGQIAANLEGGRARAEEGKSRADRSKEKPKEQAKAPTPKEISKNADTPVASQVDLDSAFVNQAETPEFVETTAMTGKEQMGNTASALLDGGFARGKEGLGAGGGGQSVGIGQLKGLATGGGIGTGDYGLSPSRGKEIDIPEGEELVILGGLDPDIIAAIIRRYLSQIRNCYEQQLAIKPELKGKVTVSFLIGGDGSVKTANVVETSLKNAPTEKCMIEKILTWKFPKPKGGGTVGVKYPFMLMSNTGK